MISSQGMRNLEVFKEGLFYAKSAKCKVVVRQNLQLLAKTLKG
jgi:hypothetical protein